MGQPASIAVRTLFASGVVIALVAACGSDGGSAFTGGGTSSGGTSGGGNSSGGLGGTSGLVPTDGGASATDCKPKTCAEQNVECGPAGDGCGGIIADCGKCDTGLRCGGPNALSKCVSPSIGTACTPKTCADQGIECGLAGDGCGGILTCPTCPSGQQCGGAAAPSKCVAAVAEAADGGACVPKTIADYNANNKNCGVQSDGCGGTIDLGNCTAPEFCGGGGPSKCAVSGGGSCTKKTCADFVGKCGPQPDGCGGITTDCGGCSVPQVCGGGGVASVCGGGTLTNGDGGACQPLTACTAGQCGKIADGCGGVLDCGTTNCTTGQICGGAGVANQCGAPTCTPITACPAGMNCGSVADGCGSTVQCGTGSSCPIAGQICGGSGQPNVCGGGIVLGDGGAPCVPSTDCTGKCGPIANGCGGINTCPDNCVSPNICGGGGTANVCGGGNACTPRTPADCATLGFNCGFIPDGCGGIVKCGAGASCPNGGVCGGITPNVCTGSSGGACTNLCLDQPTDCSGPFTNNTTTVTGTVYMPNGKLPVSDVLVYVPNGTVDAMPEGIQAGVCDTCSSQASGEPLVSTRTDYKGRFSLTNMPFVTSGTIPLVIQAGRWRKVIQITTNRCTSKELSPTYPQPPATNNTTFGATQSATNNIPKYAVTSGQLDSLQCLLRKIGVADSEFGSYPSVKRVHVYGGFGGSSAFDNNFKNTDTGTGCSGNGCNMDNEKVLYGNTNGGTSGVTDTGRINKYDALVLSCTGDSYHAFIGGDQFLQNYTDEMRSYADNGGKVFGSHWHHFWLEHGTNPWGVPNGTAPPDLAQIDNNGADLSNPILANINTSGTFAKGNTLADWLVNTHTLDGTTAQARGVMKIGTNTAGVDDQAKHTVYAVDTSRANQWISIPSGSGANHTGNSNPSVQYFDFFTPVGNATQCGRFVNSDLHVASAPNNAGTFPTTNCGSTTSMTDQERVLAFMIFDLVSCINQTTPTCTKKTCASYPAGTCGQQSDGCGGTTLNCGTCTITNQTCGGGGSAGTPSVCGGPSCAPKGCPAGDNCGSVPDGCGLSVSCGTCTVAGQTCGGGGVGNHCGTPTCSPKDCTAQGIECGQTGDGCGGVATCNPCPAGTTCGGGGVPNKCGKPNCTPITTCPAGKNCGDYPDGCGGSIHCGDCQPGQTCGGGGAPNVCGNASCSPKDCASQGAQCGSISDQCGDVDTCPVCPAGDFCNGQNLCVAPTCTPKTCAELGVECGPTADTCGGLIPDCGQCPAGEGCGAGGVAGKCGKNPCTPKSCADVGAVCGQVADGCGGLTSNCGDCQGALSCKNGACVQACTPVTCQGVGAQCGAIADGCGSIVDCGPCPPGQECGFNNVANQCGSNQVK